MKKLIYKLIEKTVEEITENLLLLLWDGFRSFLKFILTTPLVGTDLGVAKSTLLCNQTKVSTSQLGDDAPSAADLYNTRI